jgi:hypothetical protein
MAGKKKLGQILIKLVRLQLFFGELYISMVIGPCCKTRTYWRATHAQPPPVQQMLYVLCTVSSGDCAGRAVCSYTVLLAQHIIRAPRSKQGRHKVAHASSAQLHPTAVGMYVL